MNAKIRAKPITAGDYRSFLEQTGRPAWVDPTLDADAPITGVWGGDAIAIAQWINKINGRNANYRLPKHTEMMNSSVQRILTASSSPISVWIVSDDRPSRPQLWTSGSIPHPHSIDGVTLAQHVQNDVDQSVSTFYRLLLLARIVNVQVIFHDLWHAQARTYSYRDYLEFESDFDYYFDAIYKAVDLAIDRCIGLISALERNRNHAHIRVLARHLAKALELTQVDYDRVDYDLHDLFRSHDQLLNLGRALRISRNLERTFEHDIVAEVDLNSDSLLDRTLDLDVYRALSLVPVKRNHSPLNELTLRLNPDYARAFGGRTRAEQREQTFAPNPDDWHAVVMGRALSNSLSRVDLSRRIRRSWWRTTGRRAVNLRAWLTAYAQALLTETNAAGADYLISPDTLIEKVRDSRSALLATLDQQKKATYPAWTQCVADRLTEEALSALNQHHPLAADTATAIRLAALCLAAEADDRDAPYLSHSYRAIAAGITLIERRANGQAPVTETIILVTDDG